MSEKLIGSCIFGQSGGPTAVINASAYGVIKTALEAEEITKVYGASYGIKGVLADRLYVMDEEDPEELRLLLNTPSSELGSCRYKMADPEVDDTDYKRILEIFKKYDVRYFFYNGGNDSMDTCNKISRYMESVGYPCRVIGVPKTVDNDLYGTDHCPPARLWLPRTDSDRIWSICRKWISTWTVSSAMWIGSIRKRARCSWRSPRGSTTRTGPSFPRRRPPPRTGSDMCSWAVWQ